MLVLNMLKVLENWIGKFAVLFLSKRAKAEAGNHA